MEYIHQRLDLAKNIDEKRSGRAGKCGFGGEAEQMHLKENVIYIEDFYEYATVKGEDSTPGFGKEGVAIWRKIRTKNRLFAALRQNI